MKIYTKTGDKGNTALIGGRRVPKHHIRIETYGTIDELNSQLGLLRDGAIDIHYKDILEIIQNNLFTIGAALATDPEKVILKNGKNRLNISKVNSTDIQLLEKEIDDMNIELPEMTHFVLPGGHQTVSLCHIARCVCRRAERIATSLNEVTPLESEILVYLNRLSDYLFVLARKLSQELSAKEVKWIPKKQLRETD